MPDVIHWQHEAAVVRTDDWLQLDDAAELPSLDGTQHYLLSLSHWLLLQRAQPSLLGTAVTRARLGVWLTPDAAIDALLPWLHDIPMIAIHIPTLADGRGYSMARRLRTHYGYQAGLRAFGDITRDQLLFLMRCGFDSVSLRPGTDLALACQALMELPSRYQDDALPQLRNARRWSAALAMMYRALEQAGPEPFRIALASSLSAEDMVLTDLILRHELGIEIFTLDTGRLHADTLKLIDDIEQRYGYRLRVLSPQPCSLANHVRLHGVNSFYQSQALRQECCHLRKVEPLQRALQGKQAWITGQRREQAISRTALDVIEHDPVRNIPRWPTGPSRRCGITSRRMRSRSTGSMPRAIARLVARPAPVQPCRRSRREPVVGGGRARSRINTAVRHRWRMRNVACIWITAAVWSRAGRAESCR